MNSITHNDCLGVRGIMTFKCLRCDEESSNYMNGIKICRKCCEETNTCQICGKEIRKKEYKKMCEYCEDGVSIVDEKYLGMAIFHASNNKKYAYIRGYDRQGWDTIATFKMYYCPMCGGKIND